MGTDPWSLKTPGGAEQEPEGDSEGMIDEAGEEQEINGQHGGQEGASGRTESAVPNARQG